jgi:hypothetical protein
MNFYKRSKELLIETAKSHNSFTTRANHLKVLPQAIDQFTTMIIKEYFTTRKLFTRPEIIKILEDNQTPKG